MPSIQGRKISLLYCPLVPFLGLENISYHFKNMQPGVSLNDTLYYIPQIGDHVDQAYAFKKVYIKS